MTSDPQPLFPLDHLSEQRQGWEQKPILRTVYTDLFRMMDGYRREGRTLEVGGGSSIFKQLDPTILSTEITPNPWSDAIADAEKLPFADAGFANVIALDALHHMHHPLAFLDEASRVLEPGGRVVIMEPAITAVSGPFYRLFHPEPFDLAIDPFKPDYAPINQGLAVLLFDRRVEQFAARFPRLRIVEARYISLAAYPLSGGYRPWSLIPMPFLEPLLALEHRLEPLLGRWAGFRLLAVLERC